jgi:predicted RNA-binding Zn-ribbon protein involved in translation (DUF1610 family)
MNKPIEELIQRLKEPDYKYYGCELSRGEAELAISALEKQIPKKPTDIDRDYNYFECASCGNSICSTEKLESHKFCLTCGQAIDWRNEDE